MPSDPELDVIGRTIKLTKELEQRVEVLESQEHATVRIVTSDPATGYTGQFIVNTATNRAKMWAEGAWREIAAW